MTTQIPPPDSDGHEDARARAQASREARAGRKRSIRRRAMGGSAALFATAWIAIAGALVTGHDPSLSTTTTTNAAATSTNAGSSTPTVKTSSSGSAATAATTATTATTTNNTSSSANNSGSTASSVTTSQS